MDFSPEFIIDWSLNVAGYVVAGLLSVMIYSMFNRTKKTADQVVSNNSVEAIPTDKAVASPREFRTNSKLEFIKFGESDSQNQLYSKSDNKSNDVKGIIRRNRPEVLRVAREMLNAGTSPEKIKNELPVSESELSLLRMNKN